MAIDLGNLNLRRNHNDRFSGNNAVHEGSVRPDLNDKQYVHTLKPTHFQLGFRLFRSRAEQPELRRIRPRHGVGCAGVSILLQGPTGGGARGRRSCAAHPDRGRAVPKEGFGGRQQRDGQSAQPLGGQMMALPRRHQLLPSGGSERNSKNETALTEDSKRKPYGPLPGHSLPST